MSLTILSSNGTYLAEVMANSELTSQDSAYVAVFDLIESYQAYDEPNISYMNQKLIVDVVNTLEWYISRGVRKKVWVTKFGNLLYLECV